MPVANVGTIRKIVVAGALADRMYAGPTLIWEKPDFGRQRMNKVGNYENGTAGVWYTVPSWSADATYPATLSGDALVVAGSGDATVTLSWSYDTTFGKPGQVRVTRNGTVAYTSPQRTSDGTYAETFDLPLSDGDVLVVESQEVDYGGPASTYFKPPAYLDVNPV